MADNLNNTEIKPEEDVKVQHINIRVGGESDDVCTPPLLPLTPAFKIKKDTPFKKLFTAYANKTGKAIESLRFSFDGTIVTPEQTPQELDMEDDDRIDVAVKQTGGC